MRTCPNCGAENRDTAFECRLCASTLKPVVDQVATPAPPRSVAPDQQAMAVRLCPECGTENEADWSYCQGCGRRLEDERPSQPVTVGSPSISTGASPKPDTGPVVKPSQTKFDDPPPQPPQAEPVQAKPASPDPSSGGPASRKPQVDYQSEAAASALVNKAQEPAPSQQQAQKPADVVPPGDGAANAIPGGPAAARPVGNMPDSPAPSTVRETVREGDSGLPSAPPIIQQAVNPPAPVVSAPPHQASPPAPQQQAPLPSVTPPMTPPNPQPAKAASVQQSWQTVAACKDCGAGIPPGAMFCAGCGRPLGHAEPRKDSRGAVVQIVTEGGKIGDSYPVIRGDISIGRIEGDVTFPHDGYMSSRHARIVERDGHFYLIDQDSRNGTFVRIRNEVELKPGDTFLVGKQVLRFDRK